MDPENSSEYDPENPTLEIAHDEPNDKVYSEQSTRLPRSPGEETIDEENTALEAEAFENNKITKVDD